MRTFNFICSFLLLCSLHAQEAQLEGYVYESGNRGYLRQVDVTVYEMPDKIIKAELSTDADGHFSAKIEAGKSYRLLFKKDIFHPYDTIFTAKEGKNFFKREMKRQPGYLFDVTLAEARDDENVVVDAVQDARIEIYNRTTGKNELIIEKHPKSFFQFTFEQGNYYTIMIRRLGYLTKRIEAHVNIDGCIICIDGVSNLRPGVTDNLTENNTMGTLLANIELEKATKGKKIAVQDIYYDVNKWSLKSAGKKALNNVVTMMKDNPSMTIELGSHTDSRGSTAANQKLSQRRAESAVQYIIQKGIDANRIQAKGFGESQLVNGCKNGVKCSEKKHASNRRTELKITGIDLDSLQMLSWKPLEEIIREEEFEFKLQQLQSQEVYKVETEEVPTDRDPTATGNPFAALPVKITTEPETNTTEQFPAVESENESVSNARESVQIIEVEERTIEELKEDRVEIIEKVADEDVKVPQIKEKETYTYQKVKTLPVDFSGFNIKIVSSNRELDDKNILFKDFNSIFTYKMPDDGGYEYYVGHFDTEFKADRFKEAVVLSLFPKAVTCNFFEGKRLRCIE